MNKFLNYLLSLVFGSKAATPKLIPLQVVMPILEESTAVPISRRPNLTCVPIKPEGKKVRFVTRRGHLMVAEIVDRNGGGEVFLRRPGHRFGPTFRRVLTE